YCGCIYLCSRQKYQHGESRVFTHIWNLAYLYRRSIICMNRFDRITAILIQLQSRTVVRAQDIADRFNVSLRTVYRDIRSLEEAGLPLLGEAGKGYTIM